MNMNSNNINMLGRYYIKYSIHDIDGSWYVHIKNYLHGFNFLVLIALYFEG